MLPELRKHIVEECVVCQVDSPSALPSQRLRVAKGQGHGGEGEATLRCDERKSKSASVMVAGNTDLQRSEESVAGIVSHALRPTSQLQLTSALSDVTDCLQWRPSCKTRPQFLPPAMASLSGHVPIL